MIGESTALSAAGWKCLVLRLALKLVDVSTYILKVRINFQGEAESRQRAVHVIHLQTAMSHPDRSREVKSIAVQCFAATDVLC